MSLRTRVRILDILACPCAPVCGSSILLHLCRAVQSSKATYSSVGPSSSHCCHTNLILQVNAVKLSSLLPGLVALVANIGCLWYDCAYACVYCQHWSPTLVAFALTALTNIWQGLRPEAATSAPTALKTLCAGTHNRMACLGVTRGQRRGRAFSCAQVGAHMRWMRGCM